MSASRRAAFFKKLKEKQKQSVLDSELLAFLAAGTKCDVDTS